MNRLQALKRDGQSIWLDFIERKLMESGQLANMVEVDGICGLTSNPAIFQKAIGSSDQYDADIAAILAKDGLSGTATVTVLVNGTAADVSTAVRGDKITVTVSIPVGDSTFIAPSYFAPTSVLTETLVVMHH